MKINLKLNLMENQRHPHTGHSHPLPAMYHLTISNNPELTNDNPMNNSPEELDPAITTPVPPDDDDDDLYCEGYHCIDLDDPIDPANIRA